MHKFKRAFYKFIKNGLLIFIGASLVSVAVYPATSRPERELSIPLGKFAPRASATVVVCSPSTTVTLRGLDEGAQDNPLPTASVTANIYGAGAVESQQFMQIKFEYDKIKVALGSIRNGDYFWAPDFDYTVMRDVPDDFVATKVGSGEFGILVTLVLNRVTGTAILTTAMGSLPAGAHPYVASSFFTCVPEQKIK